MALSNFEKSAFNKVLTAILDAAKQQNIEEKDLAKRAQISAETLSRIKQRCDCKFSTLNAMAKTVGLRLAVLPDDDTIEALQQGEFFE